MIRLSDLQAGQTAIVIKVAAADPGLLRRLEAMGLHAGQPVRLLRQSWLQGPMHIRVGLTTEIAIRQQEAASIWVQI
jgi:ferrous iron transport protein A